MTAVKQMLFSGKPESEHEKNDLFHKQWEEEAKRFSAELQIWSHQEVKLGKDFVFFVCYFRFSLKFDLRFFKTYIFNLNLDIYSRLHKVGSGKDR